MAVTLTVNDFIYPAGALQPSLFPDGDLVGNVSLWLSQVSANVAVLALPATADANTAAAHYCYWRGYEAVALRIGAMPSTQSTNGDISTSWEQGRVTQFMRLAAEHQAAFEQLTAPTTRSQNSASSVRASNRAVW